MVREVAEDMPRTEVHKFGGTSVADAGRIRDASLLVENAAQGSRVVVVTSAIGGVTDALAAAANAVGSGERADALNIVDEIAARHVEALAEVASDEASTLRREVDAIVCELSQLIDAAVLIGDLTMKSRDRMLAVGEKLSARLLAAALRTRGIGARSIDADTFLETDERHGNATPLVELAERAVRATLGSLLDKDVVPVVTGFCGRAPDGSTTTLGRGGSDLSATVIAAALGADEVTIWTDVAGVYSADPKVVAEARVLRRLNYREAAELSFYNAKVLHQRSIIPVAGREIPVRIRSSSAPEAPGTVVDCHRDPGPHPVKAVSAIRDQTLLSMEGNGMAGVPGIAARAFVALSGAGISVVMISQSCSESSICLAISNGVATAAETALKQEFRPDLSRGDIEDIKVVGHVGLIAAVGIGMVHVPGVAASVFGAVARRDINVLAIAQGSSELVISLAVDNENVDRAIHAIHEDCTGPLEPHPTVTTKGN